jgi:type 1 fimbria pilin
MRNIKAIIVSLLGTLIILPGGAWAACYFQDGNSNKVVSNINFGTVMVQQGAPLGAILSSKTVYQETGLYTCTSNYNFILGIAKFTTLSAYGKSVYNTNIAGVGLLLERGPNTFPYTKSYVAGSSFVTGNVTASLIKTSVGSTGSGTLAPGTLAFINVDALRLTDLNLTGTSTIVPVGCSVTNTAINVPMGNVQRSTFTGAGYEGSPVQFVIPLDCGAGTRVDFKLDAPADSSGVAGVMAINSSATGNAASGVGIKITRDSVPVNFGTTVQAGVTANNGTYNIPFVARYYQTSPDVKAGQANGTATFTMTYN